MLLPLNKKTGMDVCVLCYYVAFLPTHDSSRKEKGEKHAAYLKKRQAGRRRGAWQASMAIVAGGSQAHMLCSPPVFLLMLVCLSATRQTGDKQKPSPAILKPGKTSPSYILL